MYAIDAETRHAPGRYTFPEVPELGRGALGRVRLAWDDRLGREVAIKELLLPPAAGERMRAELERRFLREARLTARLDHPGVVPVHEIGRTPDGTLYYVMKRVRGRTLREEMDACVGLGERLHLLGSLLAVAQAVAYGHRHGVIHRDLRPEKVRLGEFGEAVVLGWGRAKLRGAADDPRGRELVGAGRVAPAQMSPEQAAGELERMDERSDVWALGAVLHELLTGAPPFGGASRHEITAAILRGPAPAATAVCREAPRELASVAGKALAPDPGDRYADAGELASDLAAWRAGDRVRAHHYGLRDRAAWRLRRR